MTPFEIDILFHYYTTPTEHRGVTENPPIGPSTMQWLVDEGLLAVRKERSQYGATYECTKRGECWINHVCNLPLPEWSMPATLPLDEREGAG